MSECEERCKGECFMDCEEEASPPATGAAGREIFKLEDQLAKAISLIDGAYEVVELFKPSTPAQVEWRKEWLALAAKYFKCDVVHNFKEEEEGESK